MAKKSIKPIAAGILAALALFSLYFLIMGLLSTFEFAWQQYLMWWPWMTALIAGFGFQIFLFAYINEEKKAGMRENASVAATGGVSTVSMLACCAHHLTDIVPILGISVLTLFVGKYQMSFLILGIFSNLFGIVMMSKSMKDCGIKPRYGLLRMLSGLDHKRWMKAIIFAGIAAIMVSVAYIMRGA